MDDNANQLLADFAVFRTVQIQAVATSLLEDYLKKLDKLQKAVTSALIEVDPTGTNDAEEQQARLAELADKIKKLIAATYAELRDRMNDDFENVAKIEQEKQRSQFFAAFDRKGRKLSVVGIAGAAFLGATLADWLAKQAGDLLFRYNATFRQGVNANEPLEALAVRARGGARKINSLTLPINSPVVKSKADLETLARTGLEAMRQEGADSAMDSLPDSVNWGYQSIAVVDSRTTQICMTYAWRVWDKDFKPVGHSLPFAPVPRHFNCRSSIVPTILEAKPVNSFDFREWLLQIPLAEREQIFGKKGLADYEAGKTTVQRLIRQQERKLSIEGLRDMPDPRLPVEPD